MSEGLLSFVGRSREVDELRAAVADAAGGRGGVWFLCGEPGIGKSRLAEEVSRLAADRSMRVLWGRCWEAGGAPAFWPWIQVLRALERDGQLAGVLPDRAARIAQLLPELRQRRDDVPELPPLGAEQARFELLDAVTATLCDCAARTPTLLILEDLHVADPASVALLDFVARQAAAVPLLVLGTFREGEAQRSEVGAQLLGIAGKGRALSLARLSRDEVRGFLATAAGAEPSPRVVDAVFRATEGNPLFLVETLRLITARGGVTAMSSEQIAVPTGVRTAIAGRIATVRAATREVLELASIVGREFRVDQLERSFARNRVALDGALDEAVRSALLFEVAPGTHRFAHILIREELYQGIAPAQRSELHLTLGEALERERAPWSEIAHHYRAAGEAGRDRAVDASARAAEAAMAQLAFDDAVAAYELALDAAPTDERRRVQLAIGLGRALLRAGQAERGKQVCADAARRARELDDSELLALAALEFGSVYVFGNVDRRLIALLQEARDALGGADSALLARVTARLAAATQPAPNPIEPIELAREAIAMARRVGDEPTLLEVLRAGCSTMMDLADPAEREPLDTELVALAEKLGEVTQSLGGYTRLAFDRFELGDMAGADAAVRAAQRIANELAHPHYAWRALAFGALRALWDGRLDEAERLMDEAREVGERGGDPNATHTHVFQRARLLRLQGRYDELVALLPRFDELFSGTVVGAAMVTTMRAASLVCAGRVAEARNAIAEGDVEFFLSLGDRTLLEGLADFAAATEDEGLAARLYERLEPQAGRFVSSGVIGSTWDGPVSRLLARLAALLGRRDEARQRFDAALAQLRGAGGAPMVAVAAIECAELFDDAELAAEAHELATSIGMTGVATRAAALRGPARAVPEVEYLVLAREGDLWRLECEGETVHVKDSKGMRMLAALVAEPGREFHALDLANPSGEARGADLGDAGEMLDARARAEYQSRVAELRAELEQAEQWNDPARADAARSELEFLTAELSRAVGLGGRERRAGAAAERARVNVQRRLRDAIKRIEAQHPAAGAHLQWAVKTGAFCSYRR